MPFCVFVPFNLCKLGGLPRSEELQFYGNISARLSQNNLSPRPLVLLFLIYAFCCLKQRKKWDSKGRCNLHFDKNTLIDFKRKTEMKNL
ncbi:MAG: hypothetical protein BGO76_07080 [Caedibacter sp. 38-128]|nr:MAG: hypothetical protein BGO76_07080 [Caedibacter sp. 38-128]